MSQRTLSEGRRRIFKFTVLSPIDFLFLSPPVQSVWLHRFALYRIPAVSYPLFISGKYSLQCLCFAWLMINVPSLLSTGVLNNHQVSGPR